MTIASACRKRGQPLGEQARLALEALKDRMGTSQVLASTGQPMIQQLLTQTQPGDVTYQPLWATHHALQKDLLLRAGDRDGRARGARVWGSRTSVSTSVRRRNQGMKGGS